MRRARHLLRTESETTPSSEHGTYKTVKATYTTVKATYKTVKATYKTVKATCKTVKARNEERTSHRGDAAGDLLRTESFPLLTQVQNILLTHTKPLTRTQSSG